MSEGLWGRSGWGGGCGDDRLITTVYKTLLILEGKYLEEFVAFGVKLVLLLLEK